MAESARSLPPALGIAQHGRSSTGKRGLPVSRSSTKTNPILVTSATAGISLPSRRTRDQVRRRAGIVIPDVVVHHLEVPTKLSGRGVKRHQRIAEQSRTLAIRAVEIVRRRADGQEHHSALSVHAHDGPDIRAGAVLPGIVLPSLVPHLARSRNRVEAPH